jgi:hypothetical protein
MKRVQPNCGGKILNIDDVQQVRPVLLKSVVPLRFFEIGKVIEIKARG